MIWIKMTEKESSCFDIWFKRYLKGSCCIVVFGFFAELSSGDSCFLCFFAECIWMFGLRMVLVHDIFIYLDIFFWCFLGSVNQANYVPKNIEQAGYLFGGRGFNLGSFNGNEILWFLHLYEYLRLGMEVFKEFSREDQKKQNFKEQWLIDIKLFFQFLILFLVEERDISRINYWRKGKRIR